MKITNVGLYSNSLEIANFSFKDPTSLNPYILENIDGLDVEQIVPKFSGFSTSTSRQQQYNLSLPSRTITLQIVLNPDFTSNVSYSELRDELYRAVFSSRDGMVQLRLNFVEETVAAVSGFVTKIDVGLFANKQVISITVFCKDSRFVALDDTYVTITDVDLSGYASFSVTDTVSTLAHGFAFRVDFSDYVNTFSIQDQIDYNWYFSISPNTINDGVSGSILGFIAGDQLYVSSEQNNKQAYVIRGSETIQLMDKIVPGSIWPILFPGENAFVVNDRSKFSWNWFRHKNSYWGV